MALGDQAGWLSSRHESCGRPSEGWIFPSSSECGHFNGDVAKDQHKKALTDSGVKAFVPYTLRHTALTNLGEKAGGDVFVLARIAGHSSITVTQRYIHPQADAINRVFAASHLRWSQNWAHPRNAETGAEEDFRVIRRNRLSTKKKWCPGWESNPHEEKSPEDFKSSASAIPPPGQGRKPRSQFENCSQCTVLKAM
jgi:integrase